MPKTKTKQSEDGWYWINSDSVEIGPYESEDDALCFGPLDEQQ